MESNAILLSLLGGAVFYLYVVWLKPDRDDPKNAKKVFRNSAGLFAFSAVLALLLVLPWSIFEGWSITQVVTADLPYRKMRTTVYAIYGAVAAGGLGMLHALVALCISRFHGPVGG